MTSNLDVDQAPAAADESCAVFIIPPTKHPITLDKIDRDALFVLRKLADAGFSGYLVGGGVRDLYLGNAPKDFDISTDAKPGQIRKLFPHSNIIGRRFRLVQVFFRGGKTVEVSTLRSLSEYDLDGPEAVLAPNNTFGTLSEDARRRDLTINSLFFEIKKSTIIDYVNGTRDLDQSIIRIVGEPEKRINRDPVRMMRAIRHAARNNFTIEENSWKAISASSNKLTLCPPSRLRDEFLKDLYSGSSAPWLSLALESGIYDALFPLYTGLLNGDSPAQKSNRELLQNLYATIDSTNRLCLSQGAHRQKDFFLFALTMIPWAESTYGLLTTPRKGPALFALSREIRTELDQTLGQSLNLRRSLRQEMVGLLVNLSQFIHSRQKDGWPQRLKKKSYFKKALLFYQLYQQAATGEAADPELICGAPKKELAQQQQKQPNSIGTPLPSPAPRTSQKASRPAFAPDTRGGIFGLKK